MHEGRTGAPFKPGFGLSGDFSGARIYHPTSVDRTSDATVEERRFSAAFSLSLFFQPVILSDARA
jgi:hypothetical protein